MQIQMWLITKHKITTGMAGPSVSVQHWSRAGDQASPVWILPYLEFLGWLMSTLPVRTLYPSAKYDSFINEWSVRRLVIISLILNMGAVTLQLSCNLTFTFVGQSLLPLWRTKKCFSCLHLRHCRGFWGWSIFSNKRTDVIEQLQTCSVLHHQIM